LTGIFYLAQRLKMAIFIIDSSEEGEREAEQENVEEEDE
jgi:hypothetical protein